MFGACWINILGSMICVYELLSFLLMCSSISAIVHSLYRIVISYVIKSIKAETVLL